MNLSERTSYDHQAASLAETDPELAEIFENFVSREVLPHGGLDAHTRLIVQLAALIASHGAAQYGALLGEALDAGITPVEAREIVYLAVPYVGMAKAVDFLRVTNDVFGGRGIALPLPPQSTTTAANRMRNGLAVERQILGVERVEALYASAPTDQLHIQEFLTSNFFGDFYTRSGLDIRTRLLTAFSIVAALGGCDPQVRGYTLVNIGNGNGRARLVTVLTQLLPFIGYPRTMNALQIVSETAPADAAVSA